MVVVATDLFAQLAAKDAENARLRTELEYLRNELAHLRVSGRVAQAQVETLLKEMAKANERISELLAIAQRKAQAKKEKKVPEPGPPPATSEDQRTAFDDRPLPPPEPEPKKEPKKTGRTGRKAVPAHLETESSTVRATSCEHCGSGRLHNKSERVETKLHVAAHQRRRVTTVITCVCAECGERTAGEAPPSPFERSKVTCEWLAWLVLMKFRLSVPLDRVRNYLGAQGVALSMSFLVSQVERAADLLEAIDGEHWKELLAGSHLATDGTGFKVQIPEVGLHHGILEVYHWDDRVVFQYEATKHGDAVKSKLAKFEGTLLVDAESRYDQVFGETITEAGCNAHGRRKFRDAETVQPLLAEEGGRFVSSWFDLEEEAQDARLTGADLHRWRQDRIRPLVDRFHTWMDAVRPTLIPSDGLAKVLAYYKNHWAALTAFLDDPELPLDNSRTEREFQYVAKLRLNCLFAGGTEGAHRAAVLLGIVATCRRLKLDVEAYLTWVFVRVGTHRNKYDLTAAELTPAAYLRAHPAA
jgi:transposase